MKRPTNGKRLDQSDKPRWIRRRQWLRRRALKLAHRKRWKRHCGTHGDKALSHLNRHTKKTVRLNTDRKLEIRLPARLDFEENYEETVSHFAVLRRATRSGRRVKELSFDAISFISPSAALVLASEVDCWNQIIGGRLRAQDHRWDENIKRLLIEMGYFELLGLKRPDSLAPRKSMTFLPFVRSGIDERNPGKLAKSLRHSIEEVVGKKIKKQFLFEGLSEAMTNVAQHAYPEHDRFKLQQWWLSASYDDEGRSLSVTFYDQGEGIPRTLPSSKIFEQIKAAFSVWSDSQKIEAAMEVGRSATNRKERGKGLKNFIEFARTHREGRLSIFSLRGRYRIEWKRDGNQIFETTNRQDHENSIGGTLIEWSVKL